MSHMNALLLALALVLGLVWTATFRRAAAAAGQGPWLLRPAGAGGSAWPSAAQQFEACPYCRPHVQAARRAVDRFEAVAATGTAGAEGVRALFRERALALASMHEVRMRLPNDLDRERRWAALTEALDDAMMERVDAARSSADAALLHPGPVDDAWFGRWYRASNDAVA